MEFYTADMHFCHKNILKFEKSREVFGSDIELMNETIIENWNEVVTNEDIVNVIGDVGIGNEKDVVKCMMRLNGKLRIWPGNHDTSKVINLLSQQKNIEIMPLMTKIKTHGITVYITHYPLEVGEKANLFNIHGHIHGMDSRLLTQINVGVDQDWGIPFGQPIRKEVIEEEMLRRSSLLKERNISKRREG